MTPPSNSCTELEQHEPKSGLVISPRKPSDDAFSPCLAGVNLNVLHSNLGPRVPPRLPAVATGFSVVVVAIFVAVALLLLLPCLGDPDQHRRVAP